ncbi:sterile alpha motif domain-containing protein 3-like [Clarias magur]|uniref:Sterile alpha motif domain-containing protein 3-like n=1 Tax=Clarias magur TaxID=1594786 RepID=A0A8J4X1H5_CLAMG|nr:sterile alpha motif domain-containing protein 3-like [Clarias magur]
MKALLKVISQANLLMPPPPHVLPYRTPLIRQTRLQARSSCYQVSAEFKRITTVQLEPKFMDSLDLHTPKLLTLFRAKGGALGERMKNEMELLKDEQCSVDLTREVVIRCLVEFLGEHAGDLIKEFSEAHVKNYYLE